MCFKLYEPPAVAFVLTCTAKAKAKEKDRDRATTDDPQTISMMSYKKPVGECATLMVRREAAAASIKSDPINSFCTAASCKFMIMNIYMYVCTCKFKFGHHGQP